MCLVVKRSKFHKFIEDKFSIIYLPRPKKARKDIKVYKVLELKGLFLHSPHYTGKCWAVNWTYTSPLSGLISFKDEKTITIQIGEGFHSYSDIRFATSWLHNRDRAVYEAVIPKGSKYYLGTGGEIVSNKLKIIKECV